MIGGRPIQKKKARIREGVDRGQGVFCAGKKEERPPPCG